jgi:D-amino-acid dehydrogenase
MKIVVVGAGIVGMSCAVELSRRGHSVTVMDKGRVGHGCSYGNAGWMTPCFALPLAMPGMFLKSIKWLLNPESPLYIKPQPSLLLAQWLWKFMQAMNKKQAQAAIDALVLMSQISLREYESLAQRYPGETGFERKGLLMVAQSKAGVKAAKKEMELVASVGVPGQEMSAEELKAFEPAVVGDIKGGVYFPAEAHAEPLRVVQTLAKEALKFGAMILEETEMIHAAISEGKLQHLMTNRGEISADAYVLATGSWSMGLARQLDINVPILGGKGYAMIVPPLKPQPTHPMMLIEKKIAITPRETSLRIAGTLELVNQDFSVTQRRVNAIIKGAREFLAVPENLEIKELWRGLRPCTPDGVPMIGFHPRLENLMLACGHQMLGLQAGYGTGVVVGELFDGKPTSVPMSVFDPDRF